MLLKHRPPKLDATSVQVRRGLEHLEPKSIAVLRWLIANKVDFVIVGPVAHAIRGDVAARGPVAIVPAPYGRNFERLTRALVSQHAGLRSDRTLTGHSGGADAVTVKLTPDKLARGRRWMLRFGDYDLDIEGAGSRAAGAREFTAGRAPGQADDSSADGTRAPRYQELLYEANRFEIADGLSVEVASPEDLEHFSHVRRTGVAPEFRVIRNAPAEGQDSTADPAAKGSVVPEAGGASVDSSSAAAGGQAAEVAAEAESGVEPPADATPPADGSDDAGDSESEGSEPYSGLA
jgi:hypothetical protein